MKSSLRFWNLKQRCGFSTRGFSLVIGKAPHFIGEPLINPNKFKRLSAC